MCNAKAVPKNKPAFLIGEKQACLTIHKGVNHLYKNRLMLFFGVFSNSFFTISILLSWL